MLALWQSHFERILAGWVIDELGVPILRQREVTGFAQDDAGVDVELSDDSVAAGASTSSAATADAAWSARRPASTSPAGTRRPAG